MSSLIRDDDDADKDNTASSPREGDAERRDETLRLQAEVIAAAQQLERQSVREPLSVSQDTAFAQRLSLQLQAARPRFELAKLPPSENRFSLQQSQRGIWAPTLEPVTMPLPPRDRTSLIGPMVVGLIGAIGVAAAVALVIVQTVQFGSPNRPTMVVRSGSEKSQSFAAVVDNPPRIAAAETKVRPSELAAAATASVLTAMPAADAALAKPSVVASQPSPAPAAPKVELAKSEAAPAQPPAVSEPRPADNLSRDEIASLLKRGQDLVATGDIASGRLFLTRAAQAGNADASLALAGTFDAAVLANFRAVGVQPDAAKARAWYTRAAEQGSEEAKRRLQQSALR
jgi:cytoskeletal protein RodZ